MEQNVTVSDVRIGSIVIVRGTWGSDASIEAEVIDVQSDIFNGVPGIEYRPVEEPEMMYWAYMNQIDSVKAY